MKLFHFECVIRPAGVDFDNEPISTDADFRLSVAVFAANEESAMDAVEIEFRKLYAIDENHAPYWAVSMAERISVIDVGNVNYELVGKVSVYHLEH